MKSRSRINIFGIGDGANMDFIQKVATVGLGTYHFIQSHDAIEEKVASALQTNLVPILKVVSLKGFDHNNKEVMNLRP